MNLPSSYLVVSSTSLGSSSTCTSLEDIVARMSNLTTTSATVCDIERNEILFQKLLVFMYDLKNFKDVPSSEGRLDMVATFPCFLGLPYFSDSEVRFLKSIVVYKETTLGEAIQEAITRGDERRCDTIDIDGSVDDCAPYDIGNVLERVFQIRPYQLKRHQNIGSLLCNSGIDHNAKMRARDISRKSQTQRRRVGGSGLTSPVISSGIRKVKTTPRRESLKIKYNRTKVETLLDGMEIV